MPNRPPVVYRNHLLASLSRSDLALLQPYLKLVSFDVKKVIEKPNNRIDCVYFLEEGLASIVALGGSDPLIEVGMIGPEGMTGPAVILGDDRSPNATMTQSAGQAYAITAAEFRKAMNASASMRSLFLKFTRVLMIQIGQTAVANGRATIEERLARWILMAHDRLKGDLLPLTHEFLAILLGVRRAGVTDAVNALEGQGLIKASRGEILVRNRKGLEQRARHYYGVPEAQYRRLLGG